MIMVSVSLSCVLHHFEFGGWQCISANVLLISRQESSIDLISPDSKIHGHSFVPVLLKVFNSTARAGVRESLRQFTKRIEIDDVRRDITERVLFRGDILAIIKSIPYEKKRTLPIQPLLSNEQNPQDESDPGIWHDISSGTPKSVNLLFTFGLLLPLLLTLSVKWAYNSWLSWFKQ